MNWLPGSFIFTHKKNTIQPFTLLSLSLNFYSLFRIAENDYEFLQSPKN